MEPLFTDGFEKPSARYFSLVKAEKDAGNPVIGAYCCFTPLEIFWAIDAAAVVLCGSSEAPIAAAEEDLPSSICPLIKSSYGFVKTDTCPFYKLADGIVCETTCDGKKKMFELIKDIKPTHVMELPIAAGGQDALNYWIVQVKKLIKWIEEKFDRKITKKMLNDAIKEANHRRSLLLQCYEYFKYPLPYISNTEMLSLYGFASYTKGEKVKNILTEVLGKLEARVESGETYGSIESPRILITGSPTIGPAEKVYKIIEESGGMIVVSEACSGIKPLLRPVEEGTNDPIRALAKRYFEMPCSIMMNNTRRLDELDYLIEEFKPNAVIEVVLSGCHTYNIESFIIKKQITEKHGLPYLKIETDYSNSDMEQIRTRVQALLEISKAD